MPNPGTVVIPNPVIRGDDISLNRENTYLGIQIYLGPDWSSYLDGSYFIYLSAKKKYTLSNDEMLFDVTCSVVDQTNGIIGADLDSADTDHEAYDRYRWQVQIQDAATDPTVVKTAMVGRLIILPNVKDI